MNIFDGPEGESLFKQPVLPIFRQNPLPELFKKAEQSDDRLMALLTALVVLKEGSTDVLLRLF